LDEIEPRDQERLREKLLQGSADDCMCGGRTGRYRYVSFTDRNGFARREGAHWVTLVLSGRNIPLGMMVLHSCDEPACCNPRHLRIGTHRDNLEDARARGTWPNRRRRRPGTLA
jgi:hypothetical protein